MRIENFLFSLFPPILNHSLVIFQLFHSLWHTKCLFYCIIWQFVCLQSSFICLVWDNKHFYFCLLYVCVKCHLKVFNTKNKKIKKLSVNKCIHTISFQKSRHAIAQQLQYSNAMQLIVTRTRFICRYAQPSAVILIKLGAILVRSRIVTISKNISDSSNLEAGHFHFTMPA